MKTVFAFLLLITVMISQPAHALFAPDARSQALLVKANTASPLEGLGTAINQNKNLLKCVYDFSVLGGAAGAISLVDDQGNACVLPAGALVVRSWVDTVTAFVSAGGANIAFGVNAAADLKASVPAGALSGAQEGILTGAVTLAVGPIVASSSTVAMRAVGAAVTAGKADLFLEYVIQ